VNATEPQDIDVLPLLLTISQAAAVCQVGLDQMRSWTYLDEFPVIRSNRTVRIHRDLLDHWLRERAQRQEEMSK